MLPEVRYHELFHCWREQIRDIPQDFRRLEYTEQTVAWTGDLVLR
jgi:hypothetical protein